jgi:hypothetical protein
MDAQMEIVQSYISKIREEQNIDERVKLLEELNNLLPLERKLAVPSLITNDLISKVVNGIEEAWLRSL